MYQHPYPILTTVLEVKPGFVFWLEQTKITPEHGAIIKRLDSKFVKYNDKELRLFDLPSWLPCRVKHMSGVIECTLYLKYWDKTPAGMPKEMPKDGEPYLVKDDSNKDVVATFNKDFFYGTGGFITDTARVLTLREWRTPE